MMHQELERIWQEVIVTELRYYPSIRLERQWEPTRSLRRDIRCSIRDTNPRFPEYETTASTRHLWRHIRLWLNYFRTFLGQRLLPGSITQMNCLNMQITERYPLLPGWNTSDAMSHRLLSAWRNICSACPTIPRFGTVILTATLL
jgi:hypothetical protein